MKERKLFLIQKRKKQRGISKRYFTYLGFLFFLLIILWILFWFNASHFFSQKNPTIGRRSLPPIKERESDPVTILLWPHSNFDNWAHLGEPLRININTEEERVVSKNPCFPKCHFITNLETAPYVDAILFDWRPQIDQIYDYLRAPLTLPLKRPNQIWINFGFTNPEYYPLLNDSHYMTYIDINMTYERKQENPYNVPITFFCDYEDNFVSFYKKPSKKEKILAFLLNDCESKGGKKVISYVKELMQYIKIDSFGKCFNNQPNFNFMDDNDRLESEFSKYKFVLVMETSNLKDYVTSTLSAVFKSGSLPVYLGAPNIDDWIPSEDSIIRVNQFSSPSTLAEYLIYLDKNEEEYNKFFQWKAQPPRAQFLKIIEDCVFQSECRLCRSVSKLLQNKEDTSFGTQVQRNEDYALYFDGKTNYVVLEYAKKFNLGDTFTFSVWLTIESLSDNRIIDKNTAGQVDGYSFDTIVKGKRGFLRFCSSQRCWHGMTPLSTQVWYHVALVYVTGAIAPSLGIDDGIWFYVNGKLDYHVIFWSYNFWGLKAPDINSLPLTIGKAASGLSNFWHGMMDEISIWSIPLTQDQIQKLMFQQLGGNEEGLISYLSFNEGAGIFVSDQTGSRVGQIGGNNIESHWIKQPTKDLLLKSCQ